MAMLANDWAQALDSEFQKPYYKNLYMFVKEEYSKQVVYPPADDIFNAFRSEERRVGKECLHLWVK